MSVVGRHMANTRPWHSVRKLLRDRRPSLERKTGLSAAAQERQRAGLPARGRWIDISVRVPSMALNQCGVFSGTMMKSPLATR
jgi:hypothetical protein